MGTSETEFFLESFADVAPKWTDLAEIGNPRVKNSVSLDK
jgi:hypothetical protein